MVGGSLKITAGTAKVHNCTLGINAGTLSDDTAEFDECVEMNLSEIAKLVLHWEITDAHKDLTVDIVVVRVDFRHNFSRSFIKNWQNTCRLLSQPDSQSRLLVRQMGEVNFDTLPVILAHFLNSGLVDVLVGVVDVVAEEHAKLLADENDDFGLLDPSGKRFFIVGIVV